MDLPCFDIDGTTWCCFSSYVSLRDSSTAMVRCDYLLLNTRLESCKWNRCVRDVDRAKFGYQCCLTPATSLSSLHLRTGLHVHTYLHVP